MSAMNRYNQWVSRCNVAYAERLGKKLAHIPEVSSVRVTYKRGPNGESPPGFRIGKAERKKFATPSSSAPTPEMEK